MSKKKVIAIVGLIFLLAIVSAFMLLYFAFGTGTVRVNAYVPVFAYYSSSQHLVHVDVFENGNKIATSSLDDISLSVGKHTLSFSGDWSNQDKTDFSMYGSNEDYDAPTSIVVVVEPYKHQSVSANFIPKFGYFFPEMKYNDPTTGKSVGASNASIYMDGQPVSKDMYGGVRIFDTNSHTIYFADVPGYVTPSPAVIQITKGQISSITPVYEKILSGEQQHYAWLREHVENTGILDSSSDVVTTKFLRWTLDSKVGIPVCFNDIRSYEFGNSYQLQIYIAQYSGLLIEDRIKTLDGIVSGLKSNGYDLEGYVYSSDFTFSVRSLHYKDSGEYIVEVTLNIGLSSTVVEQASPFDTFKFSEESMLNVHNICPNFVPVGVAYTFGSVNGVYVKIADITKPLRSVYTSFKNFSNVDELGVSGYYSAWESLSLKSITDFYVSDQLSQISTAIKTGIMGSALVDFPDFCKSIMWQK
jgi:hypothetical protein